jgi:hypothetical protein
MAQALVVDPDPETNTKMYIWQNLAPWFLRAGESAPLALHIRGLLPSMVPDIMDFVCSTGFNFKGITLSASGRSSEIVLPFTVFETIASPASIAPTIEYLGVVFCNDAQAVNQPFPRIINLTHCFPQLSKLSLGEIASSTIQLPVKISHKNLLILQLSRVKLSPIEIRDILSGLPRLHTLHLKGCVGVIGDGGARFTHPSLKALVLSSRVAEACLNELTCPALTSVVIEGPPSRPPRQAGWGKMLGQFLQRRRGRMPRFALQDQWPACLLENIIQNSDTALEVINVGHFSSFYASSEGASRVIDISNSSINTIIVLQDASESQVKEFCDKIRPPNGQVFIIYVPNCKPRNTVYFPWPRLESGRRFHMGFCMPSELKECAWP